MALEIKKQGYERHGMKGTPEYQTWQRIRRRCHDPEHQDYPKYGAQGIKVCPEWQTSFLAFIRAMGLRPTPQHSIDRIRNEKGYSPDNCRWADKNLQAQNRRFVHPVTIRSKTQTIAEWAREAGLPAQTLYNRFRRGQTGEEMLLPPGGKRKNAVMLTFNGETLSVAAWAKRLGVRRKTIKERLRRGWTVETALTPGLLR